MNTLFTALITTADGSLNKISKDKLLDDFKYPKIKLN